MGLMNICHQCGSDWCSGDCCVVSPKVLRVIARHIPDSPHVGELERLADYFEMCPADLRRALEVCKKL